MRIFHLDTGMMMRGGQTQLILLLRGLRAKGHSQTLACPPASQLAKVASAEGFPVLPIERDYWNAIPAVRKAAHGHDIIAAHDSRAQTISYLATLGLSMVRVADRLVAFEPRNRLTHRLKYSKTCDIVIASSQAVKDTMVRNGVPEQQVQVIRGGIEFPEHLPPHDEARARMRGKWKLSAADFVIGHLAAFTKEKGQLDALEAVASLRPKYPGTRMILGGDGPLRNDPQIRAKARDTHTQLPGFIQPDADFYVGLDLFLANSTSEALGLAPLYAMAHGVPVIASAVGGLPEVINDGGWLIPPSDPAALAKAIAHAIEHPEELQAAGQRARAHARQFSAAVTVDRTEALYRQLLHAL